MAMTNLTVDHYFAEGCGRCPLGGTPACKVHPWVAAMAALRAILRDTELTETVKWGVPCYMLDGGNVLLLSALKDYCALSFFKGALLADPHGVLYQQSKNSQAARLLRFTSVAQVHEQAAIVREYVAAAIAIEKAGLKVEYKDTADYDFPDELLSAFEDDAAFAAAFDALTPGRQRSYLLHFSSAKQAKTRVARIARAMPKIFEGKGFHER